MAHLVLLLLLLDYLANVLGNGTVYLRFELFDEAVVEHVGAGKSIAKCFLKVVHVDLGHSFVIEVVPFAVLEGFDVAEVVPCVGGATVDQHRV